MVRESQPGAPAAPNPMPDTSVNRRNGASTARTPISSWWVLLVVSFVSLIDWADRAVLSVIIEPLRQEFGLSDAELGFLAGVAFTVIYLVAVMVIGRLADRFSRRNIIAISLSVWSGMTMAFGAAGSYVQLFAARVGIGAGAAGGTAPALSIISDVFPVNRISTAMSVFQTGGVIGFSVGAALGGVIAASYGWRYAMIGFGAFGLVVACMMLLAIKEPVRRVSIDHDRTPPLAEVLGFFLQQKSLLHFAMSTVLIYFVEAVGNFWTYSYFIRSYGLGIADASVQVSAVWLISGIPGTLLGGIVADRLSAIDRRAPAWMCAAIPVVMVLLSVPLYISSSASQALTMLFAYNFIYNMYYGPMYSIPAALIRNRMRALGFAILSFLRILVGAVGPLLVGHMSDRLEPALAANSLRYAMLAASVFLFWGAWHAYRCSLTIREDLARNPDG